MAKSGVMTGIIVAAAVAVVALAGIILVSVANRQVEKAVVQELDSMIQTAGLQDYFRYDKVNARLAGGAMDIYGFRIADSSMQLSSSKITLKVPVSEAIGLALNPEDASLSRANLTAESLSIIIPYDNINITAASLAMGVSGQIPTAMLTSNNIGATAEQQMRVDSFSMDSSNLVYNLPEQSGSFRLGSYSFDLKGGWDAEELVNSMIYGDIPSVYKDFSSLSADFRDFGVDLSGEMQQSMAMLGGMVFGATELFDDPANLKIKSIALALKKSDGSLDISKFSVDSGILTASGTASLGLSDLLNVQPPFDIHIKVSGFDENLRSFIEYMVSNLTSRELPAGNKFTLGFSVPSRDADPEITLE